MTAAKQNTQVPGLSSGQSNESPLAASGKRPTLVVLLNTHHINMPLLAKMSGVAISSLREMAMNQPVPEEDVYAVLTVFNLCYGTHYTVQSTHIPIVQTKSGEEMGKRSMPADG